MLSVAPLSLTASSPCHEPFVLLVDDDEPSLMKLKKVLEATGFRCVAATSAAEALVVCDARRPSLVVTDLSMPRLDGRGLARWLKARYPSMPILLVTGEYLDGRTQDVFQRTFAAVLPKPLQFDTFLSLVDNLMPLSSRAPRP